MRGYRIWRNYGYNTSISNATQVELLGASTTTYSYVNELVPGATYKFIIAAFNDVHLYNNFTIDDSINLKYSDELSLTVANLPLQVTDMSQLTIEYEKGEIKLNWSAASNFSTVGANNDYYSIYRDVGSGVFYELTRVYGNKLQFNDTGLVEGQKYNYQISATNVIGEGPRSNVVVGTAGQEPSKIDTLKILTESQTSLVFGWNPDAIDKAGLSITGYSVIMDDGDFVFDQEVNLAANAVQHTQAIV